MPTPRRRGRRHRSLGGLAPDRRSSASAAHWSRRRPRRRRRRLLRASGSCAWQVTEASLTWRLLPERHHLQGELRRRRPLLLPARLRHVYRHRPARQVPDGSAVVECVRCRPRRYGRRPRGLRQPPAACRRSSSSAFTPLQAAPRVGLGAHAFRSSPFTLAFADLDAPLPSCARRIVPSTTSAVHARATARIARRQNPRR